MIPLADETHPVLYNCIARAWPITGLKRQYNVMLFKYLLTLYYLQSVYNVLFNRMFLLDFRVYSRTRSFSMLKYFYFFLTLTPRLTIGNRYLLQLHTKCPTRSSREYFVIILFNLFLFKINFEHSFEIID